MVTINENAPKISVIVHSIDDIKDTHFIQSLPESVYTILDDMRNKSRLFLNL